MKERTLAFAILFKEAIKLTNAEQKVVALRRALAGLLGVKREEDLLQIELGLAVIPAPDEDKKAMFEAINVMRETWLPGEVIE